MNLRDFLPKLSVILISIVSLIAACVLVGWEFNIDILKRLEVRQTAMNPVTAVLFLLLCAAFYFTFISQRSPWPARFFAVCILVVATIRLLSIFSIVDIHIDLLMFRQQILTEYAGQGSNRLPISTCIGMILGSCAMLLASINKNSLSQWTGATIILLSLFSVFGYLYRAPEFTQQFFYLPMASHTAITFLLFATALIMIRPQYGIAGELTSSRQGSILSKYLIPLLFLLPCAIGYIRLWGHSKRIISVELGVTIIVFSITVLFTAITAVMIYLLNKNDAERQSAAAKVAETNNELEAANEEMAALNEELTSANEELLVNNERLIELNDQLEIVNRTIARQKDEQLNKVLDISSDVIWSIDLTTAGENYMSRSGEKIFGFSVDELAAKPMFWTDFVYQEDMDLVKHSVEELQKKGITQCTFRIQKSNGTFRWLNCRPKLVFDGSGRAVREIGILSDITDQRIAADVLREYQTNLDIIFSNTHEGILLLDRNGRIVLFNRSYSEFLRNAAGRLPEKGAFLWDTTIDERKEIARQLFARAVEGEIITTEAEFTVDHKKITHLLKYEPVFKDGQVTHVCIISSDVTEQKQRENELQRSEANLQSIFNNTMDHFTLIDTQFHVLAFNQNNANDVKFFTGKVLEVGVSMLDIVPPQRHVAFRAAAEQASKNGRHKYDAVYQKGDVTKWYDITINTVRDNKGDCIGYCITSHDNSEVRIAQSEILRLNHSLSDFQEAIHKSSIVSRADKRGIITFVNANFIKVSGYSEEELIGENHRIVNSGHHPRSFWANMWKTISSGNTWRAEVKNRAKDGSYYWVDTFVMPFLNADGQVIEYLSIRNDITDRKRSEEELHQSEANLRALFENTADGFVLVNSDHQIVAFNDAAYSLMHVADPKHSLKGTSVLKFIAPERRVVFSQYLDRARDGETISYNVQYNFEGSTIWLHAFISAIRSKQNEIIGYCLTLHNISEQKNAEQALRVSEDRFRAIVENIEDIIAISTIDGKVKYVSPSASKTLGYDAATEDHLYFGFDIHPDDVAHVRGFFQTVAESPMKLLLVSFRCKHFNGEWLWLEGSAINMTSRENIDGIITSFRNVTHRRLLEEDLREKKYFLEKAQQTAQLGYWILDHHDLSLKWSDETYAIFGLKPSEFDGKINSFLRYVHHEERGMVEEAIQNTLKKNADYNIDYRIVRGDGGVRWVHEQAELVKNNAGAVTQMIGVVQDITRRKHTEEVLKEFNERFELLSRATNDAIWDWDIASGGVSWNHGLETIFKYTEGHDRYTIAFWKARIHDSDKEQILRSLEKAFDEKQTNWAGTYRFLCANGIYKHVFDRAYVIYQEDRPVRMIGAMQDISDRVQATEQIEKLSFVARKTDNAVMITDDQGRIEWVNESFERMTGYSLADLRSKKSSLLQGADTDAETVAKMRAKIANKESFSGELINYTKSGKKYWLRLDITPVFHDNGSLKNFISIQSDITAQKEFEAQITTIAEEMASLIENANVPIFGIDKEGRVNEWNKVCEELSGFSKAQVTGKKWIDEMVGLKYQAACHQMLNSVLWGKPISNFELPLDTPQRNLVLLLSASPRKDIKQNIIGAIIVAQDITELIQYRQNLERIVQDRTRDLNAALQKEKELVQMKSKFVSIASHEFRTPLTTISLAAGFIKKYGQKLTAEETIERLKNIEKQVNHMTRLLDDVLTIGKSEAGKIPVNYTPISLTPFFEKLATEVEQSANRTHVVNLEMKILREEIEGDEKLMRNIIINLLTNGIKFSPEAGEIDLHVQSNNEKVSIRVRDYGIGIPPEDIDKLFEPFYRASNVNAIAGTGLGLSIIKKALDLLEGSIEVESFLGKGTTMHVVIPIAKKS